MITILPVLLFDPNTIIMPIDGETTNLSIIATNHGQLSTIVVPIYRSHPSLPFAFVIVSYFDQIVCNMNI
jgi:hypothetical protein